MFKVKCDKCPKVIEGFTEKHAKFLLLQHNFIHRNEVVTNAKPKKLR